jgi:hypothetical protein
VLGEESIAHIAGRIRIDGMVDMPVGVDVRKADLVVAGIFIHRTT